MSTPRIIFIAAALVAAVFLAPAMSQVHVAAGIAYEETPRPGKNPKNPLSSSTDKEVTVANRVVWIASSARAHQGPATIHATARIARARTERTDRISNLRIRSSLALRPRCGTDSGCYAAAARSTRTCPSRYEGTKVRSRRIAPVGARPGEGLLSEPTAGVQPTRWEQVFMPLCRGSTSI